MRRQILCATQQRACGSRKCTALPVLWLLAWARAARPPLEREVAQKESDDVAKPDAGEESKREAPE